VLKSLEQRSRHRLLRRSDEGDLERTVIDDRAGRFDRSRAVWQETVMEDIRNYHIEEEKDEPRDEEREYEGAQREEVPFEIPRD
jgi:hypothetical protein